MADRAGAAQGAGAGVSVTHYFAPKHDFPNEDDMIEGVLCWMTRGRADGDKLTREPSEVTCASCIDYLEAATGVSVLVPHLASPLFKL